ncbi:MAG: chemotaxis response regulator protein-glutamate methylesterase [Pseudomonadales bacterium]|nr:chemotaxis response regulator protein-glutamate methylesterase [Pseudomonadales bacterium]
MDDGKLRVLIVEDQITYQRILRLALADIPDVEIVGIAANGREAVEMVRKHAPDLVTLDVEMPVMNGLEALNSIRRDRPGTRVLMVSSHTEAGAEITIQAMQDGAYDFITKPIGGRYGENRDRLRRELFRKLSVFRARGLAPVIVPKHDTSRCSRQPSLSPRRIDAVAVAASTGGPAALRVLLRGIPENFPVPVFIVQHMPAMFTAALARNLDNECAIRVVEGEDGMPVESATVYLAPGGFHMTVEVTASGRVLGLNTLAQENFVRPAADVLFRSVARVYERYAVGIVLTGMGKDGALGLQCMKQAGATTFAQDGDSCTVFGMPSAAMKLGCVDRCLPLDAISRDLLSVVRP